MIISASRRTDIPAFFGQWLVNRLQSGVVLVPNPMNRKQISRVTLAPNSVDCIVFWTKNPEPFLPLLASLDALGYHYYFLYTITAYGTEIEPAVPKLSKAIATFCKLSSMIGPHRVIWRYDPIIINDAHSCEDHLHNFAAIAQALAQSTSRCIVSFVRSYRKCQTALHMLGAREPAKGEMATLLRQLQEIGSASNIALSGCCLPAALDSLLSDKRGCVDQQLIAGLTNNVQLRDKDRNQRPECRCAPSIDIGMYHCCPHLCRYCYANSSTSSVHRNFRSHNSDEPMLYGTLQGDEKIIERTEAASRTRRSLQLKLF